jgi:hypothetical protein
MEPVGIFHAIFCLEKTLNRSMTRNIFRLDELGLRGA